ncbi:MAG: ketopantoate reductase family protein [Bacteroidales bacterium]
MKKKAPEVVVIGAGGIGGITAAHASKAGFNVEIVDNMPGLSDKIRTGGIKVSGTMTPFAEKITAYKSIREVPGKRDIILLATKATALCEITEDVKSLMHDSTVVVCMQNGICEEYLSNILGRNRVLGCVVGWGATVLEPGNLQKTSEGDFVIGTLPGETVHQLDAVVEILRATAPVNITENIAGWLYSKLIINSCITTLGAICGITLGKMLAIRKIRNIFIEIIREAVHVGKKAGIRIEKYANKLDFYTFAENGSVLVESLKHLKIRIIGMKYRKLKSSSLQSLETGRKTEIDFLNGYIVKKGHEVKVNTPLNELLVGLVKEIENGTRKISIDNFELTAFGRFS